MARDYYQEEIERILDKGIEQLKKDMIASLNRFCLRGMLISLVFLFSLVVIFYLVGG